jgi:hypothetical protein
MPAATYLFLHRAVSNRGGTGSIVPALAENARTGHPEFRRGREREWKDGPPAHPGEGVPDKAMNQAFPGQCPQ